jgi:hypothetical protein
MGVWKKINVEDPYPRPHLWKDSGQRPYSKRMVV